MKILSAEDASDLRFLFSEAASAFGYRSSFSSLAFMALAGCPESSVYEDPYDDRVLKAVAREREIRAVVSRLSRKHATVLSRVFGTAYRHPPFGVFGEVSTLLDLIEPSRETIERQLDNALYVRKLRSKAQGLFTAACRAYLEAKLG